VRRRRARQPSISLFSFQDIVTSVTAILILIVLILTLELVSRRCEQVAKDTALTKATLVNALAELKAVVEQLEAKSTAKKAEQVVIAAPTPTPAELQMLRNQLERAAEQAAAAKRIADESRRLAETAKKEIDSKQELEEITRELDRNSAKLASATSAMEEDNASERKRIEERESELAARTKSDTDLVFKRPADTTRQPWLLEVSDRGFEAVRLGTGESQLLGRDTSGNSPVASWLNSLSPAADYVLVLVRPSGVDAHASLSSLLTETGIPFGIDFIGEEQTVHDGSAQATTPSPAESRGSNK